ncbi:MAG: TonB-dependent receptor [Bryobacteraceae bacterium]
MTKKIAWLLFLLASATMAQSPNSAELTVVVLDQAGARVMDAAIELANSANGEVRRTATGSDGAAAIASLPLTGSYTLRVSKSGFGMEERAGIVPRSGESATVIVKLQVGAARSEVTVYGTADGVRADAQIGRRLESSQIDETPVLGRKVTSLPLLNAAFRQAKGTGDLFVNATYFVTGVGGRRQTTVTLDGGNNDEGWGRQVATATVPIGAIQELTVLSNAFSAEYGWTSGPAVNIVTKSGTNLIHGEGLVMVRPGGMQADSFSTRGFCPTSVSSCVTPSTLRSISPVDIPDKLEQFSGSFGGPLIKDRTFFFATADWTKQDRTTFLSSALPAFVLPSDGTLDYTGHYRQTLVQGRVDHKLAERQNLMLRLNVDRFYDDNPQDAVGGTNAPSVARRYARRSWTAQANHNTTFGASLWNDLRVVFLDGDPVTQWDAQTLSTTYTRAGTVPFTIGQSRVSNLYSRQLQLADTLSWWHGRHLVRFGASFMRHQSGGTGSEPGTAVLGTFTFRNTTTAPFDQLTLADVQQYTQPIDFGVNSYKLSQWLYTGFVQDSIRLRPNFSVDLGLRYDRQTLTNAAANFAPRIGFGWNPRGDAKLSIRGGYGMYYTQIRSNAVAGYLVNGLDGLTTYTATPGQFGFPTCLTGACLPLAFNPALVPASQLPARDITIAPGKRSFYQEQFTRYGLDFAKLPNYPERLENPRSQVVSIGAERELAKGLFAGADYVHQHVHGLDRSVDLNAAAPFDRTGPGQVRTVAAANATRPILPVNGGVRQVNVLMNLGVADYDGLQTQMRYRRSKMHAAASYSLSKATNTSEPDGNGIGPNDGNFARLGEIERAPSLLDQRHRAVLSFSHELPLHITAGTLMQFASARPLTAFTGVDNNGDGANNDRPIVNGALMRRLAFRGTPTSDVGLFVESRIPTSEHTSILLRVEGFNLLNHGNYLGRGQTIYGDGAAPNATFGQLVAVGSAARALPAFANVDPPRMFQLQCRFSF